MILGDPVPGVVQGSWAFITADAHDITTKVKRKDPNAALVVHKPDGRLGIAVWIPRDKLGSQPIEDAMGVPVQAEGGAWFIAFRATDPKTGESLTGEPDGRILDLMDRYHVRHRSRNGSWLHTARKAMELREERTRQADLDAARESTERLAVRLLDGHRNTRRILVPRGIRGDDA